MTTTPIAHIDLPALSHNLQQIRRWVPNIKIMPMIKGNAYGHGMVPIAKALADADALGVAILSEALQLRDAGIKNDIAVMRGFIEPDEIAPFCEKKLIACVHDVNQVTLLESEKFKNPLRIWLKGDSGMHRLGIRSEDFSEIYQRLSALPFIEKPFTVFSHLADADNSDTTFTEAQLASFSQMIASVSGEKSLLNSAGILAYKEALYDWVRPGIMLYGISPFENRKMHRDQMRRLRPVMTLKARLIAIKRIKPGESIGYHCAFTATEKMTVGVVGVGYGDGYPRHMKAGAPVLIHEQRCPLLGRVSMDMMTVDLSHCKEAAVGDAVTLWGNGLPIEEIALCADTLPHELLCHVTGRVRYIYQ